MIHLNFETEKARKLLECIRHECKKTKGHLGCFKSEQMSSFDTAVPMLEDFTHVVFFNGEKAPRGHTENSPLVDIIKNLSANGKQVYITAPKNSEIMQELLMKTSGNIFKWSKKDEK